MEDKLILADRVSQIESELLDQDFLKTLDGCIDNLEIFRWSDELKLVIKYIVSYALLKDRTTTGKKVYNITYAELSQPPTNNFLQNELIVEPRKYKLQLMTICDLIVPYVVNKLSRRSSSRVSDFVQKLRLPWLTMDNLTLFVKMLNVINFLAFLRDGLQLKLVERALGLLPIVSSGKLSENILMNRYQMEIIFRENVWKAITEFLTFAIPFINIVRIKNRASSFLGFRQHYQAKVRLSDLILKSKADTTCGICNNQPFNPFIIGCKHVFCYYCLYSKYLLDPEEGFVCSTCNHHVHDDKLVTRYKNMSFNESINKPET